MVDLIQTPFTRAFQEFAGEVSAECFICSPFITSEPVKMLADTFAAKRKKSVRINVLTDLSYRALVYGATETSALLYLFKNHPCVHITYLPNIHAKVYIADRSTAIVASANFTHGGSRINFEYGVRIRDRAIVQQIKNDMIEYGKLGADVTMDELQSIHSQTEDIKQEIEDEQKNIARTINRHTTWKQRTIKDDLIRTRIKNRSINSIFSETLLYLLSKGPAKTEDLHQLVCAIHPDLCDESIEHMIDGISFGKKWKHRIRNAQTYLQRTGAILYNKETKLWEMCK